MRIPIRKRLSFSATISVRTRKKVIIWYKSHNNVIIVGTGGRKNHTAPFEPTTSYCEILCLNGKFAVEISNRTEFEVTFALPAKIDSSIARWSSWNKKVNMKIFVHTATNGLGAVWLYKIRYPGSDGIAVPACWAMIQEAVEKVIIPEKAAGKRIAFWVRFWCVKIWSSNWSECN